MPRIVRTALTLFLISLILSNHAHSQPTPCDSHRDIDRVARIRNLSGWDASSFNLSRRIRSEPRYDGAVESELGLRNRYFRFTRVVLHSCDNSATVFPDYLRVEHAYAISASGRTFALVLSGNCGQFEKGRWIAAMCDATIALVDTTGSGKFDLLEIGEAKPEMPGWVSHHP